MSPLIAYDTDTTLGEAKRLHAKAGRQNLFIKIPGTLEGLTAIEESIFAGVPINVTLLFSPEQYLAAAEAYTRGIERRIDAGLDPRVTSVASLFISRWDAAVAEQVPGGPRTSSWASRSARASYAAYRDFFATLALGGAPGAGRAAAAAPVREHRHQGPDGARRRCTSRGSPPLTR